MERKEWTPQQRKAGSKKDREGKQEEPPYENQKEARAGE